MEKVKTALGYLRVSTKQQVDKFGFNAQRKIITEYAKHNNIKIVDWFEESYTGYSEERPEITKILQGDYNVDILLVAKGDRFARNIEYYYALKLQLRRINIELVSASEDFGQTGILKPAMEALVASFAEIERIMIAQRTANGREEKRKQGGYCGGSPPYGYNVKNGELVINHRQAQAVVKIFELRERGYSLREIAKSLNEQGYKNSSGGNFSFSTIKTILDNKKTYSGLYHYGKGDEWLQGKHKPIILTLTYFND